MVASGRAVLTTATVLTELSVLMRVCLQSPGQHRRGWNGGWALCFKDEAIPMYGGGMALLSAVLTAATVLTELILLSYGGLSTVLPCMLANKLAIEAY